MKLLALDAGTGGEAQREPCDPRHEDLDQPAASLRIPAFGCDDESLFLRRSERFGVVHRTNWATP